MGMTASAHLAWGVDFGDFENAEGFDFRRLGVAAYEMEDEFPALFGFTEAAPETPAGGWASPGDRRAWWEEHRDPYNGRRDAAVPVKFRSYGYERSGKTLVLKRSLTSAEWDCGEVDRATLAEPTPAEVEAFGKVWEHWHIDWPMNVRLLLMASYG